MNNWIKSLRFNPTARAIPNSVDLAAASKTNTRKISNMPTIIEKDPNIENMVVTPVATLSASFTLSFFWSSTLKVVNEDKRTEILAISSCKPDLSSTPSIVNCVW